MSEVKKLKMEASARKNKFFLPVLAGLSILLSAGTVFGVTQRDFNGDGKIDILWRHALVGRTVVWLMDGTIYAGGADFGVVDTGDGFGYRL